MDTLKQKIKNTTLFDDEDKINILTAVDSFSTSDLAELEKIIDEYDGKHKAILHEFKDNMLKELDTIDSNAKPEDQPRIKSATDQIRLGFQTMIQN